MTDPVTLLLVTVSAQGGVRLTAALAWWLACRGGLELARVAGAADHAQGARRADRTSYRHP